MTWPQVGEVEVAAGARSNCETASPVLPILSANCSWVSRRRFRIVLIRSETLSRSFIPEVSFGSVRVGTEANTASASEPVAYYGDRLHQGRFMSDVSTRLRLFGSVPAVVNQALGLGDGSYEHRGPFLGRELSVADGVRLARDVLKAVADDFERVASSAAKAPSSENWRMVEQTNQWTEGHSEEVDLERFLVKARLRPSEWWNQVPIASALGGGRRQCIDLVHARGNGCYDFVELKVKSNTPIYAAVEVLQYGYFWLLSRAHRDRLGYSRNEPMRAVSFFDGALFTMDDGRWREGGARRRSGAIAVGVRRRDQNGGSGSGVWSGARPQAWRSW